MSVESPIPAQVIKLIHAENTKVGEHLSAQHLANKLQVSRSPINKALSLLEEKGIVTREPNRGCFLSKSIEEPVDGFLNSLGLVTSDIISRVYYQIADDRLKGLLSEEFSESMIRQRYSLTSSQLQSVLNRISEEGWAYKKPGYGWAFSPMLTTPESLIQSYRLRLALEPAALLEPNYHLEGQVIKHCRDVELDLLGGGIETYTADQIHRRGVQFHASIVEASRNPFFIDTIQRVHRIRLLLSYRSMQERKRLKEHCEQHLHVLELLEQERNEEASLILRAHLSSTIKNISEIEDILKP